MDEYLDHFRRDALPKIASSAYVLNIAPGDEPDPKVCLEIGAAILLDKPLVVVVVPGRPVPAALRRAASKIVEADLATDAGQQALMAELATFDPDR